MTKNPGTASRHASKRTSRPVGAKHARRLEWSPRADEDKFQAWLFIASDNVAAADRVIENIERQAALLRRFPRLGRIGRVPRTREMPVPHTPFLLVCRLTAQAIRIGRVLHHARRYP